MTTYAPPADLGTAGAKLWRDTTADVAPDWQLDARDLALLAQAARAADRIEELEALIEAEGLTVTGSKKQSRLHPAVTEVRMTRQLIAQLLARVELAAPAPRTGSLNGRQRAQLADARRARWGSR